MAHKPSRHGGSYPAPLFRAELDASDRREYMPISPDGTPIFEMAAEAAPLKAEHKPRPRVESPSTTTQANPWPFYLEECHAQPGSHGGLNERPDEEENVKGGSSATAEDHHQPANPWPYHGPQATETDTPSATIYSNESHNSSAGHISEQPAEIQLWPPPHIQPAPDAPPVPHSSRPQDPAPNGPALPTNQESYSVPLRPKQTGQPKAYVPYSPPLEREDEYVRPVASPPPTGSRNNIRYQPYRPPEDVVAQPQSYPFNKPSPASSHPASPVGHGVSVAASESYHRYHPPSTSDQSHTPDPPQLSTRPPLQQTTSTPVSPIESPPPWHPSQRISPVVSGFSQANSPPPKSPDHIQANTMTYSHPPPPPIQPSYTGSSQPQHGSRPPPRPIVSPTSTTYSQPSSPHPMSPSGSSYQVPQATYATPTSPAPSINSQQSYSTAPPQPPRPQMPHSTEPFVPGHHTPPGPAPPPYSAVNSHNTFSPSGIPSHRPPYPTQATYATTDHIASPPLSGGLAPPPLPPRPSSAQGHIPPTGFGSAASCATMYPPPPKTQYQAQPYKNSQNYAPPPSGSSRPTAGKLFSGSSAKRWLDKTNQALESTLAPIIQGPSTYTQQGHRPLPPSQNGPPPPQRRGGQPYHGPRGGYSQGPPGAYPTGPPPMPERRR